MNDRFKFRVWQTELRVPKMKYNSGIGFINNQLDDTNCVTMQCTGLKDKNGKLIYEGDICEYEFEEIGKQKAIIEFNKKYAAFLMKPLNDFQYININDCEVIGNKFENPELLKECKNK